eukprot:1433701-Prymnesium_polylepis.1
MDVVGGGMWVEACGWRHVGGGMWVEACGRRHVGGAAGLAGRRRPARVRAAARRGGAARASYGGGARDTGERAHRAWQRREGLGVGDGRHPQRHGRADGGAKRPLPKA